MNLLASTKVSIYRGTSTDDWGDPVDNDTPHITGALGNLVIRSVKASTESSGMAQVVTYAVCRVRSNLDITCNDTLKDERTGKYWQIASIEEPQNPGINPDLRLNLIRVD